MEEPRRSGRSKQRSRRAEEAADDTDDILTVQQPARQGGRSTQQRRLLASNAVDTQQETIDITVDDDSADSEYEGRPRLHPRRMDAYGQPPPLVLGDSVNNSRSSSVHRADSRPPSVSRGDSRPPSVSRGDSRRSSAQPQARHSPSPDRSATAAQDIVYFFERGDPKIEGSKTICKQCR